MRSQRHTKGGKAFLGRGKTRIGWGGILAMLLLAAPLSAQAGSSVQVQYGTRVIDPLDMISFPDTVTGTTSNEMEFTIYNSGKASITLPKKDAVVISGDQANAFAVTREPATLLQAESSTYFDLTFRPPGVGAYSATVTVTTGDSVEPTFSFEIFGYGNPDGP